MMKYLGLAPLPDLSGVSWLSFLMKTPASVESIPADPADPAEDGEDGGEVACGLPVQDAAHPQPGHEPVLPTIAAHSL